MTFNENDPFGSAAPVQETEPANAPGIEPQPWNDPTTVNHEAVSVTMKGGAGFEAPWIVVKGKDAETARQLVQDVVTSKLAELTVNAAKGFRDLNGGPATQQANRPPQRKASNNWQPQTEPSAPAAPQASAGSCEHGELVFNQWDYQGKTYRAYQCPEKTRSKGKAGCRARVWADKIDAGEPPF